MDPSQRLSFVIGQVAAEIAERGARAVAELGLDGRSLGVLMVLDGRDSATQRELGELLGIDRTTMVAVTDILEANGRVTRRRAPDRRSNMVSITDGGAAVLESADQALQHCEDEFVAGLTGTERDTVMALLAKLPRKDADRQSSGRQHA